MASESLEETSSFDCQDGCVYTRDDLLSEKRWCFGQGHLQSSCVADYPSDFMHHPCNRYCDGRPQVCEFNLKAEATFTDSDGRRADGRNRTALTYNGVIAGPTIYVCEGDTVQVHLNNQIEDGPVTNSDGSPTTTTLHFHGIREVGLWGQDETGPWSDGVPFVNQCPIESKDTFHYKFKATSDHFNAPQGTYWYHSHVGAQRTNGLQGALVIKPKVKGRKKPTVIDILYNLSLDIEN